MDTDESSEAETSSSKEIMKMMNKVADMVGLED